MQSHIAIRHLEESIKPSKRSNKYDQVCDWFDNMREESARKQIQLYKIWKGRLQLNINNCFNS